jgi:hypothetical protein
VTGPSRATPAGLAYFRAADRPGCHQQHLGPRRLALTGVDIDDEKHDHRQKLQVVQSPGGQP